MTVHQQWLYCPPSTYLRGLLDERDELFGGVPTDVDPPDLTADGAAGTRSGF
jgi:hypothetical protein